MKYKKYFVICFFVPLAMILLLSFVGQAFAKKTKIQLAGAREDKVQNQTILERAWSQSLKGGGSKKRYFPETSNPVLDGSIIYVGTHGARFYAVDRQRGKVIWTFENDEPIASTARVVGGQIYFTDLGGSVVCLNQANGALVWKQVLGREMLGQPLVAGERLYLLKGEQTVVALNKTSGNVIWEKFIRTYLRSITMRGHASMILEGGILYLGLGDGHLYALNTGSGDVLWDKNLTLPLRTFKDIDARVVVVGDALYVGSYSGAVYKLNKRSGTILWSTEITTGVPVVAVGDVVVVADTHGSLVGLDANDGSRLWINDLSDSVLSEPVLYDGKIFVSSFDEKAYLVSPKDGTQIQKMNVGDGALTQPLVDGTDIYLLTNQATLVALRGK